MNVFCWMYVGLLGYIILEQIVESKRKFKE